jgi:dipeptidyl-peptidase-4
VGTTGHSAFDAYYDAGLSALTSDGTGGPAWSPDGAALAYLDGELAERRAWQIDLQTGQRCELLDVESTRAAIEAEVGIKPQGKGLPFVELAFVRPGVVRAQMDGQTLAIDLATGAITLQPALEAPVRYFDDTRIAAFDPMPVPEVPSPDGEYFLFTRDHNLAVRSTVDGREVFLTQDGCAVNPWRFDVIDPVVTLFTPNPTVVNWSPDGSRIAAYRDDYAGVKTIPQVHNLKRVDEVVYRYFASAGGPLERTTLWVLDVFGRSPVQLDLGDTTDSYLVHAGWVSDGEELLVFRLSRDCKTADIFLANAKSGVVRHVFSESGETFLRTFHDVYTGRKLGLWIAPDRSHWVWASERSGFNQLYLYNLEGTLLRQLTEDDFPVQYVSRIDLEHVYFTAHSDRQRPYDSHLHRVAMNGGTAEKLTEDQGVHTAQFSPVGDFFIDTWSRPDQPPASTLRRADGTLVALLSTSNKNRLNEIGWVPPREFTVNAADDQTELWGTMFFPNDFDQNETYPLIEHIYGGPYWAVAPHTFEHLWYTKWSQALAQLGYVVVMVDARGTPGRSKAFHDFIVNNWTGSIDDHAEAMGRLAAREGFLDATRIGIFGHSWGGYFAFRCLSDRPDIYKAAVSYAPAFDVYAALYYESYLGFPQYNRRAYEAAETFPRARDLQGALMLACGTGDHFQWSDTVKMAESLIQAEKQYEFVVLPGQAHFFDPSHDRHFWRKVANFFMRHLQPASHYESLWAADEWVAMPTQQTTPRW